MTQTIDQRARELLIKHYKLMCPPNMTFEDPPRPDWYEYNAAPVAALTEALTRIEELEVALKPFAADYEMWRKAVDDRNIDDDHDIAIHTQLSVGDLRKASTTLTQGIGE